MVTILSSMWATAIAQTILPWFVFWPLFFITQTVIWTCIFIGLFMRVVRALGRVIARHRYAKWHAQYGEAWMQMQQGESIESYKVRVIG